MDLTGSVSESLTHTITVEIDVAADTRAEALALLQHRMRGADIATNWRFAIHERPDLPAVAGEYT